MSQKAGSREFNAQFERQFAKIEEQIRNFAVSATFAASAAFSAFTVSAAPADFAAFAIFSALRH